MLFRSERRCMNYSPVLSAILGVGSFIFATGTPASTLSLQPVAQDIQPGSQVALELRMDFSDDPTLGGGLDVFYNPAVLNFVKFEFAPAFPTDPFFSSPGGAGAPTLLPGQVKGIGFGRFDTPLAGPYQVGTLTFAAMGAGTTDITLAENILPLGGFFSGDGTRELNPVLMGASVTVVPIPASLWLLASALLGVAGITRRKPKAIN